MTDLDGSSKLPTELVDLIVADLTAQIEELNHRRFRITTLRSTAMNLSTLTDLLGGAKDAADFYAVMQLAETCPNFANLIMERRHAVARVAVVARAVAGLEASLLESSFEVFDGFLSNPGNDVALLARRWRRRVAPIPIDFND